MNKWIVCADRIEAVVYSWKRGERSLSELKRFSHPKGALSSKDLISDKPGRVLNRGNLARNTFAPKHEATEVELRKFAKEIAEYLEKAGYNKEFDRLTLSAEPRTLGIIKQELGPKAKRESTQFLNQELTKFDTSQLKDYLTTHNL